MNGDRATTDSSAPPRHADARVRSESSAFVSANAGSGKTHVLVQRVIRLLLRGVPPEKILCITFTKAAAANMAERVFSTLGHWVTLDDEALDAALTMRASRGRRELADARRELFARALETPGGLKVQTIHALCTRLLQQFPFEANVPARFDVLDDRDQTAMMERASLSVLLDASREPDSNAGRALATAMGVAADVTFSDVVREACLSRDHFMAWTDESAMQMPRRLRVSDWLNVDPDDRIEASIGNHRRSVSAGRAGRKSPHSTPAARPQAGRATAGGGAGSRTRGGGKYLSCS